VEKRDFESAFSHTIESYLYPIWVQSILNREKYLFRMSDLYNEKVECLKLVKIELSPKNRLRLKFEPNFARKINYTVTSPEKVQLFNIHFKQVPNLKQTKLKAIGQNVFSLTNGAHTRKGVFEFWQQIHRLRLPINFYDDSGSGDNIHFCEFETGEIYPFCNLMRDLERKGDKSEQLLLKLLKDVKRHVEKTEVFDGVAFKFINAETNLTNVLLVSDEGLSTLNSIPSVVLSNKYDISTKFVGASDDHLKINNQASIRPVKFYQKQRSSSSANDSSESMDDDVIIMSKKQLDENNNFFGQPDR
jgi:hypothetical protein